mmetsp:Transcript_24717/g.62764  ORF Transcript_24717/g.62764 Transcript_24717/m.62764 type:complete len:99 (-) Transcript_24717:1443-1739(-)
MLSGSAPGTSACGASSHEQRFQAHVSKGKTPNQQQPTCSLLVIPHCVWYDLLLCPVSCNRQFMQQYTPPARNIMAPASHPPVQYSVFSFNKVGYHHKD